MVFNDVCLTYRGIEGYSESFGLDRKQLLAWIAKKTRVLDIGAGGGVLEREIEILRNGGKFKSKVEIIPFDIAYQEGAGPDPAYYASQMAYTYQRKIPTREDLRLLDERFNEVRVGGSYYERLPFDSGYFDGVLASYSVGIHTVDRAQLMRAYKEIHRVMSSGGTGMISVSFDPETNLLHSGGAEVPFQYSLKDIDFMHPRLHSKGGMLSRRVTWITVSKD